jgi:hypothetical protein
MMTKHITTALTTLTLCLSMTFMAGEAHAADPVYNDEGALVDTSGPTKKLTFVDGDTLEGEVLRLDQDIIYSPRGRHHNSLIPIKYNFISELISLSWDAPWIR